MAGAGLHIIEFVDRGGEPAGWRRKRVPQRFRGAVAAGGRMGGIAGNRNDRGKGTAVRAVHGARSAGDSLQRDGASYGDDRDRHFVHGHHELSVQGRRRYSALDFPGSGKDDGDVHHRGVRDRVHGGGGDGIDRVSGPGDRGAGYGDRRDRRAVDVERRRRMERSAERAANESFYGAG